MSPIAPTSRRRVAFIGTSFFFVHQAVRDMILNGHLEETDVVLYDIDRQAMRIEYDVIRRMLTQSGSSITVTRARSRRAALEGADYVIVSVLVGGLETVAREHRLCRRHGIRHTVGDTIGPMCIARILRQAPLMVDIARDMARYCPQAVMLSPTNPMTAMVTAIHRYADTRTIGVCHGTQAALALISKAYDVSPSDVRLNLVGVNHLGFIDGVTLRDKPIPMPEVFDRIRGALDTAYQDVAGHEDEFHCAYEYARRCGFLPNNGDHHFLEFFRWYLAPDAFDADGRSLFGIDGRLWSLASRRRRHARAEKTLRAWLASPEPIPDMDTYGGEYMQDMILALEGRPDCMTLRELHLNVPNGDAVENLPRDAILEITTDRHLRPVKQGVLDAFRWGVLTPLIAISELAVKAAIERDRQAFLQAMLLDPLMSDYKGLPALADALWAINEPWAKPQR